MEIKRTVTLSMILFILNACFVVNTFAQVPLVYDVENTGAACAAPPLPAVGQLTSYAMLPDPFAWSNGSGRITSFADWTCRRNEIKQEIEQYEIGIKPPKPANITATYTGGTLTVNVTENGQTLTLTSRVTMPTGTGPFPVVIGMNAATGQLPANLFNGVIQIPFNHDQVARYTQGTRDASYPFFRLYPNLTSNGYYSAWAWGISRLIDGIEIVKAQMNADTKRIAVTGCSYAGKMALFAGAFDERIALTIAQESGGGGVNSWRVSETIGNVEKIGNTNYSWFMQSMQTNFQNGNAVRLPHDHHELMAMIAPRALLVLGNPPFEWLGDESGYVSSRAAQDIWKTLGVPDRFGFSFRGGHDHCSLPSASNSEVTAFVDKFLRNITTANTNIAVHSFPNTDYDRWITAWKGHVLTPVNTNAPVVSISAPLTNASYTEGDNITIHATATIPTGTITKVDFYQGTTLLGTDANAPYTFTWNSVSAGKYQITAKATGSGAETGTSSVVTVIVTKAVFQTSIAPTIDGTIDALWSNYTAVPITNVLSGTVASAADLSGSWKAIWDVTNLYVLVDVTDNVKRNDAGTDVYNDDGVEVYVDFGNNKPTAYGANDHQYTFRWNDATAAYEINGHAVTGITKGITNTTAGYVVEVRIPWATIGGVPTLNSLQGFDVMINDDDNGAARDKKMAWSATADDTWNNPSLMGTIILKGLNCSPPAASITAVGTTTVCAGTSVTLNANTGTGFTYVWKKDNVDIVGATAASYAAAASGSYTVMVTSAGCSATSTATTVTVNALPNAPVVSSTVAYCQNAVTTQLTATGTGLKWYVNNTTTTALASAPIPSTTTVGTTNYYVSQTTNGCESARALIGVLVNALPTATITAGTATTFCQGGSVILTVSTGSSYIWKKGNEQVGTIQTLTASETGSYTVEVTNSNNCKATSVATTITVNALPNAPTVTSSVVYCQNAVASQLTATGTGLKWYVNNTTTTALASAPTPSTTTAGTTNYYVSQTTNGCESSRALIGVTVNALPTATINITTPTVFCQGGSVILTASTGSSYIWKKGNEQVGTSQTYTAGASGSYTVEVTNTSNCKATSVATTITVNVLPNAPTVTSSVAYCQNAVATQLTATGTGLKWYVNNTTTTALTSAPIPTTTTVGTTNYYVSQTTNGCESARALIGVTVNALPTATITAGTATTFCQGGSVILTASIGSSYIWKKGNEQVGTAQTYTANVSGSYTVEITNTSNCKATSVATTVTVNATPNAPTVTSSVAYCQNAVASQLTATGTGLKWYVNNTTTTSLASAPIPMTTTVGTANYYVSQTTNGCESARALIGVTVNALPTAIITPSGSTTISSNGSVVLNANAGSGLSYVWFRGINQVGAGSSYTATEPGSYTVEVTNSNNCKSTSSGISVTRNTNQPSVIAITSPVANETIAGSIDIAVNITDPDGNIVLVEFLDGDNVIGTSTTAPYIFTWVNPTEGSHTITVRVTDSNDGITTSDPIVVTSQPLATGVQSSRNNTYSKVYPVPARDEVIVETNIDLVGATFSVVNVMGQQVALTVYVQGNDATLNVSELSEGAYILFIRKDSAVISTKINVVK